MHPTNRACLILGLVAGILLSSRPSDAQYTANFQTNIISGVTSNWSGSYAVGNSFSADALLIQSNGLLGDVFGYVGFSLTTSNNNALVTDSGSTWSNEYGFYIGNNNSIGNSLVISNGGWVLNGADGFVGQGSLVKVTSNSVVVTDTGSVWSNGGWLVVGYPGAGNRVVVKNGGLLINGDSRVGSYAAGSSNNSVVVTDTGSVWSNTGNLYIGDRGVNNTVTLTNGGKAFCVYAYVGNEIGASNNSLQVTGAGTVWSNWYTLNIGYSGAGNSLSVLSGGNVYSSLGCIGSNTTAVGNSVVVAGSGSVWTHNGVRVGGSGGGNRIIVMDGGFVNVRSNPSGGPGPSYIGDNISSSNNSALVSGAGSTWRGGDLYVGNSGSGNSLVISNGGHVVSMSVLGTFLGYNVSSSNNTVLVSDTSSLLSNASNLYVGYSGARNSLVISNGGQVICNAVGFPYNYGCFMGYNSSSTNNKAIVTGPGSLWSTRLNLYVGYSGGGNSLVISNGGQVVNADAYVGYNYPHTPFSNQVRVAEGGVWENKAVFLGYQSNSLVVAGGSVFSTGLIVGVQSPTCDNWVQLDSGSIVVTNVTHDAAFEVRYGKLILIGGVLQVDQFIMTNVCAQLVRTGGTLIYGTAVLDPTRDDDGDGMPNGWEQSHGLDPLNAADANADADGDGQSNLAEYQAGTDPNNSASVFRITEIRPDDDDMFLTWTAVGGKWYVLQTTMGDNGSFSNDFVDLDTAWLAPGTGETNISVLHLGAATNGPAGFYRVRLVP